MGNIKNFNFNDVELKLSNSDYWDFFLTKDDYNKVQKEVLQYTNKYKSLTDILNSVLTYEDLAEAQQIQAALAKVGVNLQFVTYNGGKNLQQYSFKLGAAIAPAAEKAVNDANPAILPTVTVTGHRNTKPKMQYTANENFPLKFGQRGKKIAQLQAAIGQQSAGSNPYDGIFGPKTEALVKLYYPQYNRTTGVTEEIFNTLMSPKNIPLSNTKLNTNLNRFKTPVQGGIPAAAPAPENTSPSTQNPY
jgi:hypothetical protein